MRRLVSVAVSRFEGPLADLPLPFADGLRNRLVAAMKRHGYAVDGVDSSAELTSDAIAEAVQSTLDSLPQLSTNDAIVVHLLSHGCEVNRTVQIVGSDGRASSRTSLDAWLADASGPGAMESDGGLDEDGPGVLFLVDVCGAGQAARQPWQLEVADERRRVWVIAGCLPGQPGFNGRFTEAVATVLENLRDLDVDPSEPFVPLPALARAIRREVDRLCRDGYSQRVTATRVDISAPVAWPAFFDNPAYQASPASKAAPELREFVVTLDDLVDPWHFIGRASGAQPDPQKPLGTGFFRGRGRELRALRQWLIQDSVDDNFRVVTGCPGAGKSALLGILVCATHPSLSTLTRPLWSGRAEDLPPDTIPNLVAIHAREQDAISILGSIGKQLGLSLHTPPGSVDDLLDGINRMSLAGFGGFAGFSPPEQYLAPDSAPAASHAVAPYVVVIDAIDEAAVVGDVGSDDMADVLRGLTDARYSDGRPIFKLIVGSRRGGYLQRITAGKPASVILDLDVTPDSELRKDVEGYLDALLATTIGYRSPASSTARRELASAVAAELTSGRRGPKEPRWGEFLVAGLFARYLAQLRPITSAASAAETAKSVPRTLPQLLELDLSLQTDPWVRPVMAAIAHSFGSGMPRSLIIAIAPVFAAPSLGAPSPNDVARALFRIGFYLRRDVDFVDGVSVYRLFHHALSEHLRRVPEAGRRPAGAMADTQSRILDALLVGLRADTDRKRSSRWADVAVPYQRRHAIEHAVIAGRVDELLTDEDFLVHADAGVLARHLHHARSEAAKQAAAVYRTSMTTHEAADPASRRSILAIDAARHQCIGLAERLSDQTDVPAPWIPAWATGSQASRGLLHTIHSRWRSTSLRCIATAAGAPLAVAASSVDRLVDVWNLSTARHVGQLEAAGDVKSIEVYRDFASSMVLLGTDTGLEAWDIDTGTRRFTINTPASAVLVLQNREPALAITAEGVDRVKVWDISSGELMRSFTTSTSFIRTLAHSGLAEDTAVLAGDARGNVVQIDLETTKVLRLASLGRPVKKIVTAGAGTIKARERVLRREEIRAYRRGFGLYHPPVESETDINGYALVIDGDGAAYLLDGDKQHVIDGNVVDATCMVRDDRPVAVVAGADHQVSVWDMRTREHLLSLAGHSGPITSVRSLPAVYQDFVMTTSADATARVWDIAAGQLVHTLAGHASGVTGVEVLPAGDGTTSCVTYSKDAAMRVWSLEPEHFKYDLAGHTSTVTAVTMLNRRQQPIVVTGSLDGGVKSWDAETGLLLTAYNGQSQEISAIAALDAGEQSVVVTACGPSATVWDLYTGTALHQLRGHFMNITATRCAYANGRRVAVTSGFDAHANVWDLDGGKLLFGLKGHESPITALALATTRGRTSMAVTGGDDRTLRVWDIGTGRQLHLLKGHQSAVTTIATGETSDGMPVAVSGSSDRRLHFWNLNTGEPYAAIIGHTGSITASACGRLSDGTLIAVTGGVDNALRVWDLARGHLLMTLRGHRSWILDIRCMVVGSDSFAVTIGSDNTSRVWDLAAERCIQTIVAPEPLHSIAATNDGSFAIATGWDVILFRHRDEEVPQ